MNFRKLESFGGIGSVLTGLFCSWIGYTDYQEGQAWHIWAIMTVVLIVNGILMMLHKRLPPALVPPTPAKPVEGVRIRSL
jgi:hypothetical protein